MNRIILFFIEVIFFLGSGIGIGWIGNNLLDDNVKEVCSTQARIGGLWLPDIQELKNYNGKYICINIDETKTISQLESYCMHEVGHEIWARYCEKNFTKCKEIEK